MSLSRTLLLGSVALLIVISGCGGGGNSFNPNNVVVGVTPASPTVTTNGQVPLQVTVSNDCSTCSVPSIFWSVTENGSTASCTWINTLPTGPCPAGTVQLTGANTSASLTAVYYSPGTAGTYHVVANAIIADGFPNKEGTSVVTVGP
jgi:hypothetical protein